MPTVLLAVSLTLLIIINLFLNPTFWMTPDTEPVASTPIFITVLNGILFITGAVGLLSLLPGIGMGIFLLARNKRLSKA